MKLQDHEKFMRKQRPEMFCKKGVLRNFAKFTGKHLCQSLFNKVACLRPFFTEHLRWLHLFMTSSGSLLVVSVVLGPTKMSSIVYLAKHFQLLI